MNSAISSSRRSAANLFLFWIVKRHIYCMVCDGCVFVFVFVFVDKAPCHAQHHSASIGRQHRRSQ